MQTILIIEDEAAIADTVVYALETEGFSPHWVALGTEGVRWLEAHPETALVVLDVGLPDGNGFEICKTIRRFSEVPIVFLTARCDVVDRIVGLEIGGDDYLVKPFSPRELAARVKAILRRGQAASVSQSSPVRTPSNPQATFGVDRSGGRIQYHGRLLELTRTEYLILLTLLRQPERIYSRALIMDQVWTDPEEALERAVDTHIKSLRAKLRTIRPEEDPIRTHRGLGYSISGTVHEP